jgi:hypothetical protein
MADAFTPTSKPPSTVKVPKAEPVDVYIPPLTSLTPDPEDIPKETEESEVLGSAPISQMAEPAPLDHMMTDITVEEMAAGKKAAEQYAKRREAEFNYGKKFAARRNARIME